LVKRVKSNKPIERLIEELREVPDAVLLERVRWLDRDLWSAAIVGDPALAQRYRDAKEAFHERKVTELRLAEQPILDDLRRIGIDVPSIWNLGSSSQRYDAGIPILLAHAERGYPDRIREGIYRIFAARRTRAMAWDDVLRAYLREPNKSHIAGPGEIGAPSGPKEGMAVALSGMASRADLATLIALISEPNNGRSRIFFVANLARSRSPLAFNTLVSLAGDSELATEIGHSLKGKLRRRVNSLRAKISP